MDSASDIGSEVPGFDSSRVQISFCFLFHQILLNGVVVESLDSYAEIRSVILMIGNSNCRYRLKIEVLLLHHVRKGHGH